MLSDKQHQNLIQLAEQIAQRSTIKLRTQNVYMIWSETAFETVGEMIFVAQYLCQVCDRIVIFTTQDEFTHLIIARSSNIPYIDANTIIEAISHTYNGEAEGDQHLAYASYYQHQIMPEIVDKAVELVIRAIP